ncbi:kelch-like protein 30 [Paramacrobiotus metropolitanus]|uniref:kelch-like protein 30 n=1 Tax=Paramacrobiotus metropolitanus TaxID=2943436 RepID=UPI00244590E8|nr:kelch-like protein 30 [Paramacrobiotus metropolitanus]
MMGPKPKKLKPSDQADSKSVRIQLRIGSSEVSVDKAALAAESAYFATLFAGNFKESASTAIQLQQPANVCLETLVQLVEKGRELSIERKDAVKVWMAAKYLQMEKVEKRAGDILDKQMERPKHAYRLWRLARRKGMPDLETLTFGVIFKKFLSGAKFSQFSKACQAEFLKCSVDEVTALLSHADFVPQSEAMVYQMIMWWCAHDATERMQHVYRLLSGSVAWDDLDLNLLIATASGQLLEALKQIAEERQMGCGALLKRAAKKEAIFYHMRKGHPHQLLRFDFIRNELTKLDTPVQAKLAECWPRVKADGFAVAVGRELILPVQTDGKYDDVIAMDCISGATRSIMGIRPSARNACVSLRRARSCSALLVVVVTP